MGPARAVALALLLLAPIACRASAERGGGTRAAGTHTAAPVEDPRVEAARARLILRATRNARVAGLTPPERAVYRELLREAFRHVMDEDMEPAEIARETGVTPAVAESALVRARRYHLLDLSALSAADPFSAAEAMDAPWVRAFDDSARAVLRRFFQPSTPPARLRDVLRQLGHPAGDDARLTLAAQIMATSRMWNGASRAELSARLLTIEECGALRAAAAPDSVLASGATLAPGAHAALLRRALRGAGLTWSESGTPPVYVLGEVEPSLDLTVLGRLVSAPAASGRARVRSSRRR